MRSWPWAGIVFSAVDVHESHVRYMLWYFLLYALFLIILIIWCDWWIWSNRPVVSSVLLMWTIVSHVRYVLWCAVTGNSATSAGFAGCVSWHWEDTAVLGFQDSWNAHKVGAVHYCNITYYFHGIYLRVYPCAMPDFGLNHVSLKLFVLVYFMIFWALHVFFPGFTFWFWILTFYFVKQLFFYFLECSCICHPHHHPRTLTCVLF